MTKEEAIKHGEEQLEIFGGEHKEFIEMAIKALEQESIKGHCKDCKYFITDYMTNVDGMPLIVAHEICTTWGDGCKTEENGYCFLFKSKESED